MLNKKQGLQPFFDESKPFEWTNIPKREEKEEIKDLDSYFYFTVNTSLLPIFQVLKSMVTEAYLVNIDPENDCLTIRVMDDVHVALFNITISLEYLLPHNLDELDKAISFVLHSQKVHKFLRTKRKETKVIRINKITFRTVLVSNSDKTCMPYIPHEEFEDNVPPVAKLDKFKCSVELGSRLLYDTIKEMARYTDIVKFRCGKKSFSFISENESEYGYLKQLSYTEGVSEKNLTHVLCELKTMEKQVVSLHPMEYLETFVKLYKLFDTVTLTFGMEYPLLLQYRLDKPKCYVHIILAPSAEMNNEMEFFGTLIEFSMYGFLIFLGKKNVNLF